MPTSHPAATATATRQPTSAPTDLPTPLPGYNETTINYKYDPLYRLTEANYASGDYYHYTYDAVGNRLTQTTMVNGLPSTVDYVYDNANRLTTVNGVTYTWDDNGNLLNDGVKTYAYDSANRLKTISGQQLAISYGYNGLNDRLQQIHNGQTTTFTMDLNTGLTQALSDGTNTYIYGNGRIAQSNGTGTEYFLGDALGSVRQLTNNNGAVTYASTYDPYGVTTQTYGASQTAYGFTNEYASQGLVYLRARMYSPEKGRFLTRDTWEGDANLPMSFNMWNYVHANPVNFIDPSGQIDIGQADEAFDIVNDLKYNYQIEIKTDWGVFEQGTLKFVGLVPEPLAYYDANGYGCTGWVTGLWTIEDLRAIRDGVHIMDKGISFLGGDFKSLAGKVSIESKILFAPDPSTTGPGKIYWRAKNNYGQQYALYTTIHEMGHALTDKKKMDYFMSKLKSHCSNQPFWRKGFYCDKRQGNGVVYDPGKLAGDTTDPIKYMPSKYATLGSYEDFAETWREVVVKAYIDSGDTAYLAQANLVYKFDVYSHDIGQRRVVMTSIIDGSWK